MADVSPNLMSPKNRDDLATRRIRVFERRYGTNALYLACHAAFPLTLTSDLLYCLRENFVSDVPWYAVADVLLSGLCQTAGYDLYEMEGKTRDALLRQLCDEFGEQRLKELANFMSEYIASRLQSYNDNRALVLGERPKWTALAYLSPDAQEAINAIKQELQRLIGSADGKERIKWAALVESYADLLSEKGFQPLLLEWAQQTLDNQPIQDEATKIAAQMGITLQPVKFQVAIITQEDEPTEELQPFDFVTVTVDARGQVVNREKQRGFYFVELLADDNQVDFEESEKLKEELILLEEKDRLIKVTQELSQNLTYQQTTIDEKKTYFNLIKINERISEIDETLKRLSPQKTQQKQIAKLQQQLFYLSNEKNNLLEDKKFLENNWKYVNTPPEQTKLQQDLLRVDKEISQIEKALEELPLPVPLKQTQQRIIGLEMVAIPGGEFVMGSPPKKLERLSSESPQHTVTVQPFFMGKYPVTQAQWQFVAQLPQVNRKLDPDPFRFEGANRPVEKVSWYDAVEFCDRLSQHTGRNYRLPSEAEWEYACRAGTTTPFHFGETITTDLANYDSNYTYGDGVKGVYRKETTDVGSFGVANNFGLYDMHGNIYEWCLDDWHNNYEGATIDSSAWFNSDESLINKSGQVVLRGGSWINNPKNCRSAYRNNNNRDNRNNNIGFRVVCAVGRSLHRESRQVGICRECNRRVQPVPVMSVTVSENKTGLGSLVGVKAEDLPNSQ